MLIRNLDTDPNALKRRECWRATVTKQSDGTWHYVHDAKNTECVVQPSQHVVPDGGVVIIRYAGDAKLTADVPTDARVLHDTGAILVMQTTGENICAVRIHGDTGITLRNVTVLGSKTLFDQLVGLGAGGGFTGDLMPLTPPAA